MAATSGKSTENISHVFPRTNCHIARVRASVPLEVSMAEMGISFAWGADSVVDNVWTSKIFEGYFEYNDQCVVESKIFLDSSIKGVKGASQWFIIVGGSSRINFQLSLKA